MLKQEVFIKLLRIVNYVSIAANIRYYGTEDNMHCSIHDKSINFIMLAAV